MNLSRFYQSTYLRILGVFVAAMVAVGVVAFITIGLVVGPGGKHGFARPMIKNHINYMVDDIGVPPNLERAKQIVEEQPVDLQIIGPGVVYASSDIFLNRKFKTKRKFEGGLTLKFSQGERFIEAQRGPFTFLVRWRGPSLDTEDKFILFFGLIGVLVVLAISYFMVQRLFAPVRQVKEGAARISSGDIDYRIPEHYTGELGDLCTSVNQMANSLQSMLDAKRELLLAISHELRTPLTRAKLSLEFIEQEKTRERIAGDINEMDLLIGALLETERLNPKHAVLAKTEFDLVELINAVVTSFCRESLELKCPEQPVIIFADSLRIELLLKNIISNAVRYGEGKAVSIDLVLEEGRVKVTVQDQGAGLTHEQLVLVTQPFYRTDSARTRDKGGVGLGLYLSRLIVEAHEGVLNIASKIGDGVKVEIELPSAISDKYAERDLIMKVEPQK